MTKRHSTCGSSFRLTTACSESKPLAQSRNHFQILLCRARVRASTKCTESRSMPLPALGPGFKASPIWRVPQKQQGPRWRFSAKKTKAHGHEVSNSISNTLRVFLNYHSPGSRHHMTVIFREKKRSRELVRNLVLFRQGAPKRQQLVGQ